MIPPTREIPIELTASSILKNYRRQTKGSGLPPEVILTASMLVVLDTNSCTLIRAIYFRNLAFTNSVIPAR